MAARSARTLWAVGSIFMVSDGLVRAQCPGAVELYATTIADACGWDNEDEARGNPGNPSACDTHCPPATCGSGGSTPYAVQDLPALACGSDACSRNYTCSCPGDGAGGGTDCECLLKATQFQPYVLPPNQAIQRVEVEVQCRYNHDSSDPSCSSDDTGKIRIRVEIPSLGRTADVVSSTFTSDNGQCKYRSGGAGNITENPDLGMTADPLTGRTRWQEQDINNLIVGVGRVRDGNNTALRVNAFRIRVTQCEDWNHDSRCDVCGDGVVDCNEQCDGGDCCDSSCHFLPSSVACRAAVGPCDLVETCSGNAASCPSDSHLTDGTSCNDENDCTGTDTCRSGTCVGVLPPVPSGSPLLVPPSVQVIAWSAVPGATGYDVVFGDLLPLLANGGRFSVSPLQCLANDTPGTSLVHPPNPVAGNGYWYLTRPVNCAGAGTYGTSWRDSEIAANPSHCP